MTTTISQVAPITDSRHFSDECDGKRLDSFGLSGVYQISICIKRFVSFRDRHLLVQHGDPDVFEKRSQLHESACTAVAAG